MYVTILGHRLYKHHPLGYRRRHLEDYIFESSTASNTSVKWSKYFTAKTSHVPCFNSNYTQFIVLIYVYQLVCWAIEHTGDRLPKWRALFVFPRISVENLETSLETWVYLDVKTCKVFLCFVAIGRIRAYYVRFLCFTSLCEGCMFLHQGWAGIFF